MKNTPAKKQVKSTSKKQAAPTHKKKWKLIAIIISIIIAIFFATFLWLKHIFFTKYAYAELEIEKKYLLDFAKIPYKFEEVETHYVHLDQSYITFSPEIRLRKVNYVWLNRIRYLMTIKSDLGKSLLSRGEIDIPISKTLYHLLYPLHRGTTIKKTRYDFGVDGHTYEIDDFHDQLDGLSVLEVEFDSEEEALNFVPPHWVIKDVTEDKRYKNASLSKHGLPEDFHQYNFIKND